MTFRLYPDINNAIDASDKLYLLCMPYSSASVPGAVVLRCRVYSRPQYTFRTRYNPQFAVSNRSEPRE